MRHYHFDFHKLKRNLLYLHVVDEFSRFSAASLIANKSLVAKSFLKNWVAIFGAPKKVFTDNGGEFDSSIFHELCEKFNIKIQTTPLYSPWSNGVCERQNQTLTSMLLKIKDSEKCDYDTALAWAVSAKNSLVNHNGFSPSQLVFGQNPNLPNFINNKLPAQEPVVKSPDIITYLTALHTARKSCIESESYNKLKTALRKNVRSSSNVMYEIGDEVFFKRDDSPE